MLEIFKFSIISTLITVAAGIVMWQFSKGDFSFCDVYNEGLDLYKKKRYKQALIKFKQAYSKYPMNAIAHYNAGLCNLAISDFEAAKVNFENALKLVPDDMDTLYNYGLALAKLQAYGQAKNCFSKLLEVKENDADALFNLGYIAACENKMQTAKDYLEKSLNSKPDKPEYKRYYFEILEKINEETQTNEYLNDLKTLALDLLETYPTDENLIYKISVIYAKLGDWENTILYCERLYNLNPNSANGCNQYALALFCKGETQEAISMYERAIAIAPDIPDSYMNLVFAYDRLEKYEEAVKLVKVFISKFPDNPNVELARDYLSRQDEPEEVIVTEYVDERGRPISVQKSMSFSDVTRDYADANVDAETDIRD